MTKSSVWSISVPGPAHFFNKCANGIEHRSPDAGTISRQATVPKRKILITSTARSPEHVLQSRAFQLTSELLAAGSSTTNQETGAEIWSKRSLQNLIVLNKSLRRSEFPNDPMSLARRRG